MGKARAPHMLPPAAQGRARTDPMAKPFGARGLRRKYAAKNRDAIQKSAAPPPCTPPQLLAGALKCVRDRGAGGRCSGRPTSTSPLIGRRPVPHLRVGVSFLRLCMQTVHRRCSNCHVTSANADIRVTHRHVRFGPISENRNCEFALRITLADFCPTMFGSRYCAR